jgi:ankyrin repeat protein
VVCFELLSLTVFVSQHGITALHYAAANGHLPVVEFLFEHAPQLIEMLQVVSAVVFFSALSDSVCVSGWYHTPPLGRPRRSPPCGGVSVRARTSAD